MKIKEEFKRGGFSLVQIMIAMGIMGILSIAMMEMQKQQAKSARSMEVKIEINQFFLEMQGLLSKTLICTLNFQGKKLDKLNLDVFFETDERAKFAVGEKFHNQKFIVHSFRAFDFYFDDEHEKSGVVEMIMDLEKTGKIFGSRKVHKKFSLNFILDNDEEISSCRLLGSGVLTTDEGPTFDEINKFINEKIKENGSENNIDGAQKALEAKKLKSGEVDEQIEEVIKNNPYLKNLEGVIKMMKESQKEMEKMMENSE